MAPQGKKYKFVCTFEVTHLFALCEPLITDSAIPSLRRKMAFAALDLTTAFSSTTIASRYLARTGPHILQAKSLLLLLLCVLSALAAVTY